MKASSQFGREGGLLSETFASKNHGFGIYLVFGIVIDISAANKCFRTILEVIIKYRQYLSRCLLNKI